MKILGWEWQGNHPDHKERLMATRILRWSKNGWISACIGSIVAVYILDAIFFVAWAPSWELVGVFLLIAVTIRSCGVFAGPLMQRIRNIPELKKEARTVRALSVIAGLLCLVPALSFFAGGHRVQTQGAIVAEATTEVSDTNKAARIQTLQKQIARIEKGRDDSISEANMSIQLIADDGVPGISPADNQNIALLRQEIQKYRADASTQIEGLEAQIGTIEQDKETVQTQTAATATHVSPAEAIFAVLGSVWGDAAIWGLTILFAFALLVEAMAFFGLGAIEGMIGRLDTAIMRVELEVIAHKAQVEAEHARQKAIAEQELAEIRLRAAEAQSRTAAIAAGEDPDIYDAMRAAERNLRRAEANSVIASILRKADSVADGTVIMPATLAMAAAAPPEPAETLPPIEPLVAPPPMEERSDASQRARNAGKSNAHMNKADQLESVILVNDNRARNASGEAAPVAAE